MGVAGGFRCEKCRRKLGYVCVFINIIIISIPISECLEHFFFFRSEVVAVVVVVLDLIRNNVTF